MNFDTLKTMDFRAQIQTIMYLNEMWMKFGILELHVSAMKNPNFRAKIQSFTKFMGRSCYFG